MLAIRTNNNPNVLGQPWIGMNGLGNCGGNCGMGQVSTATIAIGVVALIFLWPMFAGGRSSKLF